MVDNIEDSTPHFQYPTLPTEVEENAIDYCADDIATLRRCALTCRDWLPRSRIHLFSAIRLSTREDIHSLCDFLDAHPARRTLIRSIIMAPTVSETRPAFLLETFPVQLLSRLPKLRGWALRNDLASDRKRNVYHHPIILRQLRISSPVVDLELVSLNFTSLTVFLRFITSFTRLRHLRCNTIRFDHEPGALKPYGIGTLQLTTFQVGEIPADALCTLLGRTASTLESLFIASEQDVDGVSPVLSRMSRLRSLTFNIKHKRDWNMVAKAVDGAKPPSLRSFRANVVKLDDLRHIDGPAVVHNLETTFLAMKLQSFTVNVCADSGVKPISTTFWSMATFEQLYAKGLYPQLVFTGTTFLDESYPATCITMSPNSQWVAGAIIVWTNSDLQGILLWDISDGASVRTCPITCWHLSHAEKPVSSIDQVVFSPDNERLLILSSTELLSTARVQCLGRNGRAATGPMELQLNILPIGAAWTPRCIVFLTRSGTLSTWDSETYQKIGEYKAFELPSYISFSKGTLLFSPDYRWLVVHFYDPHSLRKNLPMWQLLRVENNGETTTFIDPGLYGDREPQFPGLAGSAGKLKYGFGEGAFSPEGTQMAILDRRIKVHIWDTTQATPTLFRIVDTVTPSILSTTVPESRDSNTLSYPRLPTKLTFSGDGSYILALHIHKHGTQTMVQLEVYDAKTGRPQSPIIMKGMLGTKPPRLSSEAKDYHFSPCRRYLVASPLTGGIMVWRIADGSLVRRIA